MRRYWVIAPQHATRPDCWERAWKYDLDNNIISLGWNKLGDCSLLSEEQLQKLIDRRFRKKKPGTKSYILRSLWNFYHSVKPRDVVIASHGRKAIAGIGTVTRKAYYEHNKNAQAVPEDPYSNHLDVRWEKGLREQSIGAMLGRHAIHEISERKVQSLSQIVAAALGGEGLVPKSGGGGFGSVETNRRVEKAAIQFVRREYEGNGWSVHSVEAEKVGYDLRCDKGDERAHLEVKGTQGDEVCFIITAAEVRNAMNDSRHLTCVVTGALTAAPKMFTVTRENFAKQIKLEPVAFRANMLAKV